MEVLIKGEPFDEEDGIISFTRVDLEKFMDYMKLKGKKELVLKRRK